MRPTLSGRRRLASRAVVIGSAAGLAVALTATMGQPSLGASRGWDRMSHRLPQHVAAGAHMTVLPGPHRVVARGLDNPRQLSLTPRGDLIVGEAGHGSYKTANCSGSDGNVMCVGITGKVARIHQGKVFHPMAGLLSGASPDGTFAVGSDGASKRPAGAYYSIITFAPPDVIPQGLPGKQSGKLLAKRPGGHRHIVANISRYEFRHDPDGEGPESDPYSVLALRHRVLVADAAGDDILQWRHGKLSLWSLLPEYGKRVDAVPTVIAKGHDGRLYVGELHSEQPHKAKVWQYNRRGDRLRSWGGFTTVTGVARKADGTLYVSELFGGPCGFDRIPHCFPGRVVKVSPNGHRSFFRVPFPAGITVRGDRVNVVAFSIAPHNGALGNPSWSGQVWRINF